MTSSLVRILSVGLFALWTACSGSNSTNADSDALCARQRDNAQRCHPTQSACSRQADYNDCIAAKGLYRPELTTAYLACYPSTVSCDSAAQNQAQACGQAAASQVPVTATMMLLVNNICQRCATAGGSAGSDTTDCAAKLTTNATDLARALRYYTDETLGSLNTCLTGASPPADGCVALGACFQKLVPTATASACGDGGT